MLFNGQQSGDKGRDGLDHAAAMALATFITPRATPTSRASTGRAGVSYARANFLIGYISGDQDRNATEVEGSNIFFMERPRPWRRREIMSDLQLGLTFRAAW
jgi:hypothetical protein